MTCRLHFTSVGTSRSFEKKRRCLQVFADLQLPLTCCMSGARRNVCCFSVILPWSRYRSQLVLFRHQARVLQCLATNTSAGLAARKGGTQDSSITLENVIGYTPSCLSSFQRRAVLITVWVISALWHSPWGFILSVTQWLPLHIFRKDCRGKRWRRLRRRLKTAISSALLKQCNECIIVMIIC